MSVAHFFRGRAIASYFSPVIVSSLLCTPSLFHLGLPVSPPQLRELALLNGTFKESSSERFRGGGGGGSRGGGGGGGGGGILSAPEWMGGGGGSGYGEMSGGYGRVSSRS